MMIALPILVVSAISSDYLESREIAEFSCNVVGLKDAKVFSVNAQAEFDEGNVKDRQVAVTLSVSRSDLQGVRVDRGQMSWGQFPILASKDALKVAQYDFVEFSNLDGKKPEITPIVVRVIENGIKKTVAGGLCEVNWKASK